MVRYGVIEGICYLSNPPRFIDINVAPIFVNFRATSITNVAYTGTTQLTRRSSERELGDSAKKRAISASGLDRQSEGKIYARHQFLFFLFFFMHSQSLFISPCFIFI